MYWVKIKFKRSAGVAGTDDDDGDMCAGTLKQYTFIASKDTCGLTLIRESLQWQTTRVCNSRPYVRTFVVGCALQYYNITYMLSKIGRIC